jgi:hypothetical protein
MRTYPVPTDAPVVIGCSHWGNRRPLTIAAVPGGGGTLLVETQTAPGGKWFPWSEGAVSAATQMKLDSKVHTLKFTAAVAAGSVELGF